MFDPRTGKEMRAGATIENVNPDMVKYDQNTGKALSVPTTPQAITSANLTPNKPVVLPDAVPQTGASATQDYITSTLASQKAASDKAAAEQQVKDQQAVLASQKSDLNSTLKDIMGANTAIANAPNTIDRTAQDKAQKEADTYTSQIEAEQLANRRAIEALQKNPQGLFGGGLEQEINRINNISVSKQADLAILQNSALRNWKTASEIADRQLSMKLEPLKANLENLKFFYEQNKADFNKADDRLYAELVKKSDAELKKETDFQTQIMNMKLTAAQNGAPASVLAALGRAKTIDEAVLAIGEYASDPLDREIKRLQAQELRKKIGDGKTAGIADSINQKVSLIDGILKSPALDSVVGTTLFSRGAGTAGGFFGRFGAGAVAGAGVGAVAGAPFAGLGAIPGAVAGSLIGGTLTALQGVPDTFSGERQAFIGGVEQLIDQEFLNKLIETKAQGATFGALSNAEGQALRSAATKIGTWRMREGGGPDGKVIGYNTSESAFKSELQTIEDLAQKAILRSGGTLISEDESAVLDSLFNKESDPSSYFNK